MVIFKLVKENRASQTLLKNKYLRNKTIPQVEHMLDDFLCGLMKVKNHFM